MPTHVLTETLLVPADQSVDDAIEAAVNAGTCTIVPDENTQG